MELVRITLAGAGAACAFALSAHAQTIDILLTEGQAIAGIGNVIPGTNTLALSAVVNDDGDWTIRFVTDNPDPDVDEVVMRTGIVVFQEGDTAPVSMGGGPMGTFWDFSQRSLNPDLAYAVQLENTPQTGDEDTLIWHDQVVLRQGDPATPAAGWPAGTTFDSIRQVDALLDGRLVARGRMDDPATFPVGDYFYCSILTLDAGLSLLTETVLARSGQLLPGQVAPDTVLSVRLDEFNAAFDNDGRVMFSCGLNGSFLHDAVVYLYDPALSALPTLLAQEGSIFVPEGQPWGTLAFHEVSLNDNGDWLIKDTLSGPTTDIIVVNGATFRKDGYVLTVSTGPKPVDTFGAGPALLDDRGGVLYYVEWPDPANRDSALVHWNGTQDDVLLEEGTMASVVGVPTPMLVGGIGGLCNISANGRYVLANVVLGGLWRLVLIDLAGPIQGFCTGDGGDLLGCTNCPCGNDASIGSLGGCRNSALQSAELQGSGTPSVAADTLRFEVVGANPSTFGILTSGGNRLPNNLANPCLLQNPGSGIISPGVIDGLRCVGGNLLRHGSRPSDANGDIGVTTNGWGPPNGPVGGLIASGAATLPMSFMAGQTRHFQCFYREVASAGCMTGQNTTNGVSVEIQP